MTSLPPPGQPAADPFTVLGLPRQRDLSDDEVRAAWRRVAAATHPDRDDGGDPEAFAAAAAAYTALRTRFGRGEVIADLAAGGARAPRASGRAAGRSGPPHPVSRTRAGPVARLAGRVRAGRPGRLALRVLAAAAVSAAAVAAAGFHPAAPALVTGALTWLVRTGRADLARPEPGGTASQGRGRQRSGGPDR